MNHTGAAPVPHGTGEPTAQHAPDAAAASGCGQEVASGCGQEVASGCGQAPEHAADPVPTASPVPSAASEASAPTACGQQARGDFTPLSHTEMEAWRAFLSAATAVVGALNRELEAEAGISMHEYEILVRLSESPQGTMRMSDLAREVSHSRSRMTNTVTRLEKGGFVERVHCSADRRGVNCHLTERGHQLLREVAPLHLTGVRHYVVEPLAAHDLPAFTAMMTALAGTASA